MNNNNNLCLAPLGSDETGNSQQSRNRQCSGKYWVFTWWAPENTVGLRGSEVYNYNNVISLYPPYEEFYDKLRLSCNVEKYSFQFEWNEEGTNIHMQGALIYKTKGRPAENFRCGTDTDRIKWLTKSRRASVDEILRYTWKKDGSEVNDSHVSNFVVPKPIKPVIDRMEGKIWKSWQLEVKELLKKDIDDRKIHWYVDLKGGQGKTSLAHHICMHNADACYCIGKVADMQYLLAEALKKGIDYETVIMDFPRKAEQWLNYDGLEMIKNGFFMSGKYESSMYTRNVKRVIVFSNFKPDIHALSEDRWDIREIGEDMSYLDDLFFT